MRDCLFLVADKNMEGMLKGLFSREAFHRVLGCGSFSFDVRQDLVVAHGQADSGLYTRANELLQPYANSHQRVVVIIDAEWSGSPGREAIQARISRHLLDAGWPKDCGCAVVIAPELENWVWQNSPHVCSALGFDGSFAELRAELERHQFWRPDETKPCRPKEAVEWILRRSRKARSSAVYQELASRVTTQRCTDDAFQTLRNALQRWFPLQE